MASTSRPRHGSDEYGRADETLSHRVARLDERLKAEERRGDERHGQVLRELGEIARLIRESEETCREARDASHEASAQLKGLRRVQDDHGRRISDQARRIDRIESGAPMVVREFGSQPIAIPTHPTPPPMDPPQPEGVQVKAWLSSALLLRILAVLGVGGGGALLAKLPEWLGGGG